MPKTQLKGIVDICSNVVEIPLHSLKGVLKSGAIKRARSVLSPFMATSCCQGPGQIDSRTSFFFLLAFR